MTKGGGFATVIAFCHFEILPYYTLRSADFSPQFFTKEKQTDVCISIFLKARHFTT
ncbi:MAG: hypothetical protein UZ14_CFX002002355 [Chloroflexi bacterium OLB14]|nr:MAG: hypothetical protein UZ14_CFX002002355 [Chloroflexi bacterium OLB14]